jgi:hypothetical protein
MPNHTHHQTHFRLGTTWSDGCYKVVVPRHDESTFIVRPQALMCLWGQVLQHVTPQVAQLQTNFVHKTIMVLAFCFQH